MLPLWNPFNCCGTPFLANIQNCVLYPLSVILYLPDFSWAFNFYILVHLALAGFFCCVWMKDCGASKEAAFLSGMSYCLSGYVMSTINLTISLATLAYFPLALLTLRRSLASKSFFWKGAAGVVLLVQYLAGDPTIFFVTMVVLFFTVIYKSAVESIKQRKPFLKYVFDFLKIVLVFIGLSAFHTLLFFEFLRHSDRAVMSFDGATSWSMQYNDIISIFFPYFSDISMFFMKYWERQSWMDNGYAGITVLLLAFAAFKGARKNHLVGYHAWLALFGLALALGRFTPVYKILYYGFPFFGLMRYPVRFFFILSFGLSCLAGFGLDELLSSRDGKNPPVYSSRGAFRIALLLLFLLTLVIVTMFYSDEIKLKACSLFQHYFTLWSHKEVGNIAAESLVLPVLVNLKRTILFVCLFLLGVLGAWHLRARRMLLVFFFTIIVFFDLIDVNVVEARLDSALHKKAGVNMSRVLEDPGIYRVLASPQTVQLQYYSLKEDAPAVIMNDLKETMAPNLLLPLHVADVSGYDSIYLEEISEIGKERRNIQNPTQCRLYDMMNIKYVVSPNKEIAESYERLQETRLVNLFINKRVLPRAYLVPDVKVLKDRRKILKMIASTEHDPESWIYLEKAPPTFEFTGRGGVSEVRIDEYTPNHSHMQVTTDKAQWLFFSDMYYPGWKASVNGRAVEIYRANYAFRAIQVPAGESSVEWKYDPILFKIGLGVSLFTFLGLIIGLWRGRRRQA